MIKPTDAFDTQVIHAGEHPRFDGAITTPIFQTAMFETKAVTDYHENRYIRLNNTPNHLALHEKLRALEGAEAALVASSGMAAISTALLTVLGTGGHLIAQQSLYGGTYDLLTQQFPALGFSFSFVDAKDPSTWEDAMRPTTRAFLVESLTNPTLEVADFEGVVAFAKKHRLTTLIDNTFASPVNFRPIQLGFDVVLHSCTKYLNGHSDLVAGAAIGRADLIDAMRKRLNLFGGTLDPHACFLLQRGMKTLALRVRHQNETAMHVARHLEAHGAVARVYYPGLQNHPGHGRARQLFSGFGGMIAFELKSGRAAAERLISKLRLVTNTVSLGGIESLITLPASTAHAGVGDDALEAMGITAGMMRLSIGLEDKDDLTADFDQALAQFS